MRWRSVRGLAAGAGLLAVVLALGWALPPTTAVERSDDIAAPPATLYEILTDLRFDRRWSPWRDAHSRYLFSGPPFGAGAAMEWTGRTAGAARVTQADRYTRVVQALTLSGRVRTSEFRLTRSAEGTRVVWRVERSAGANPLARWANFLSGQEGAAELERGLDRLEDIAEPLPHVDMQASRVELRTVPKRRFAYLEGETDRSREQIGAAFSSASRRARAILTRAGAAPPGGPVWITSAAEDPARLRYRAGYVIEQDDLRAPPGLRIGEIGPGWAVQAEHTGGLAELPQAEAAVRLFRGLHQLAEAGPTVLEFSAEPGAAQSPPSTVRLTTPVRIGP